MKNAYGYTRTATAKQTKESNAIEWQSRAIRKYCKKNKIQLFGIFADIAKSGLNLNRPGIKKMLRQITKKPVDFVVISDSDRLSRNKTDYYHIKKDLAQNKTYVLSVAENIKKRDI